MADTADATQFTSVDETSNPSYFVRFLDSRATIIGEREVKELQLTQLEATAGMSVLDVGCGTGDDARELGGLVGTTGRIVGLDSSAVMITESRRRSAGSSLPVEFVEGDVRNLQFAAETFDRTRADRVFVHLEDPETALAEMVRSLKPGGRVVVSDVDVGTLYVDSPYREITRKIFNSYADHFRSGWVGRSLPRLLQQAGLQDVTCVPMVIRFSFAFLHTLIDGHLADPNVASLFAPHEFDTWWQDLAKSNAAGHFSSGESVFTAAGRKP